MQFVEVPDFLVNATNVYRTNGYIVRQELLLHDDEEQGTHLFRPATPISCVRPSVTESMRKFSPTRHELNGRRIKATMYVRKYVD